MEDMQVSQSRKPDVQICVNGICSGNQRHPSQGCRWFFKKKLIRLWNSILPEPGQPSAQLFKLIRLTACKKTKHTVSRWYRTVYIWWLVASYDTYKGKRWLNYVNPKPQGLFMKTSMLSSIVHEDEHSLECCSWRRTFSRVLFMKTNILSSIVHEYEHSLEYCSWRRRFSRVLFMKANILSSVVHEDEHALEYCSWVLPIVLSSIAHRPPLLPITDLFP